MANFLKSLFVKGVEIDPAGASSDQVLKYNGTKFVPGTASTVGSIDDLSDVAITSPTDGQVLKYNTATSLWANTSASGVAIQGTAPASTSVLWADTSVTGTAVIPTGGTTSQVLAKTSSSDYATAWIDPTSGFRNVLINGNMQVAQRGTSATSLSSVYDYKTVDRWLTDMSSAGTWTQTQSTDAPPGFARSLKMQCTTANASLSSMSYLMMSQPIEGFNVQQFAKGTASAKPFTLSFWIKAFQTGTYAVEIYDNSNSRQVLKTYTISASATWEYKTLVFPADITGAFLNSNAAACTVGFWFVAGTGLTSGTANTVWAGDGSSNRATGLTVNSASSTSNYFQITGVQLEANTQATPFEQRPIGVELALCQRYFQQSRNTNMPPSGYSPTGCSVVTAFSAYSLLGYSNTEFAVPMRAAPTITMWSTGGTLNRANVVGIGDYVISTPEATERGIHRIGLTGWSASMSGEFLWQALAEL